MDGQDAEESIDFSEISGHSHEVAPTFLGPLGQQNARSELGQQVETTQTLKTEISNLQQELKRVKESIKIVSDVKGHYEQMTEIQKNRIEELESKHSELKKSK